MKATLFRVSGAKKKGGGRLLGGSPYSEEYGKSGAVLVDGARGSE